MSLSRTHSDACGSCTGWRGPPRPTTSSLLRLRGVPDVEALAAAVNDVVAGHESLRTVFPETKGSPEQRILPRVEVPLHRSTTSAEELSTRLVAAVSHHFDLAAEIPIRAELLTISPDDHVLLLLVHHIACDGWSCVPLMRDLAEAYGTYPGHHAASRPRPALRGLHALAGDPSREHP